MGFVDPISLHRLIDKAAPWLWESYGFENQMLIAVAAMSVVAVIPLLVLLYVAATVSLRDVAYESTLIPVKRSRTQ